MTFPRILSGLLLLALAAAEAQGQEWTDASQSEGRSLALVVDWRGTRVVHGDGTTEDLDLPEGAHLFSVRLLSDEWLATGIRPEGRDQDLLLLLGGADGVNPLPPPGDRAHPIRTGATAVAEGGHLVGLIWLEGDDYQSFAVRGAARTGQGWSTPETISPPGPGSQMAPTAVVLPDGSWLVAWSAFDGRDTEILWSRRTGGTWSFPAQLSPENELPDVTPSLVAAGGGALVAWSSFDGRHYRVRLARFEGDDWRQTEFEGEPGSTAPRLGERPGGAWLLYRTTAPDSWTLLDVDRMGIARRRARADSGDPRRPLVELGEGLEARFRWTPREGEEGFQELRSDWAQIP